MKLLLFTIIFIGFPYSFFSQTIEIQNFATGFSQPVEIVNAGDNRLFVVEKTGVIKIVNNNGTINPTPFLDISALVGSGGERGLLGLAFAPDYSTSGRFYVNYTDNSSTTQPKTIIARYTVSANQDAANTSGTILLTYQQPFSNHNGGKLAFGQDGLLYIGSGDGGSGGDPGDRAQAPTTLLGKILRIDVSGANYSIPPTNPYSGSANGANDPRPEIYAIGLRNPWKFSFDKTNGDLWIADVGQDNYEEINKISVANGAVNNFGWRCFEGNNHIFNTTGNCSSVNFNNTVAPVAEYAHVGNGCSGAITGGYLYRGSAYSGFIGKYFFADYCKQTIGVLTDSGAGWSLALQTPNITEGWTTFGEDVNGEIYIAGGSTVYKIVDANLSVNTNEVFSFKLYPNPSKEHVAIYLGVRFNEVESISVYNIQGQKIQDILKPNQETMTISTQGFRSGLYLLEINLNSNLKAVKKLIVN
uniref:PQQ-dependent sugar dehydrogenase n=1 Tax=Mariniflexile sp. TaxID=1979402 RepID=UPI00404875A7